MAAQAAAGPPPMTRTSAVSSRPPLPAAAVRVRTRISGPPLAVSTPGGPEVLEAQPAERAVEVAPVDPGAELDRLAGKAVLEGEPGTVLHLGEVELVDERVHPLLELHALGVLGDRAARDAAQRPEVEPLLAVLRQRRPVRGLDEGVDDPLRGLRVARGERLGDEERAEEVGRTRPVAVVVDDVDHALVPQLEEVAAAEGGVDVAGGERRHLVRGLQVEELEVALGQAAVGENAGHRELVDGAASDRDPATLEVGSPALCVVEAGTGV